MFFGKEINHDISFVAGKNRFKIGVDLTVMISCRWFNRNARGAMARCFWTEPTRRRQHCRSTRAYMDTTP